MVNPGVHIPSAATRVHGITNAMVATAPLWEDVGRAFWAWVLRVAGEHVTFAGHNAARFDYPLLLRETARLASPLARAPASVQLVDTLAVCRAELRLLKTHRQAAVYAALFGQDPPDQHEALGDVRALRRILAHPPLARAAQRFAKPVPVPEKCQVLIERRENTTSLLCKSCGVRWSAYFSHACATSAVVF